jgi:hypothetical protein
MSAPAPKDPVDRWIADIVPNRSFVDVGGIGVNAVNERVTFAAQAGASKVAMADIRPFDYYEWNIFNKKCADAGLDDVARYEHVDIADSSLSTKLPRFDVVHCTGIFYHLPSPVSAFENLQSVVGRYLIVNTVTVPERIETASGSLTFSGNVALFLPGMSDRERRILAQHYDGRYSWAVDDVAPPLERQAQAKMPYRVDGRFSSWPYWWLMSDDCFRSLIRLMGLAIRDEWKWDNHCLFCLCERE